MNIDVVMRKVKYVWCVVLAIVSSILTSCVEELQMPATDKSQWETVKIAVVAPLSDSNPHAYRYERIAKLFNDNILKAQEGDTTGMQLEIEWYDDKTDIYALSNELLYRNDLSAVVCLSDDDVVDVMANKLDDSGLPFIVATTSEELVRKYSVGTAGVKHKEPFMWSVCETDVTISYTLLTYLSKRQVKKISLLAPLNRYGNTFDKWVPFYAIETKIDLEKSFRYADINDMPEQIDNAFNSGAEYVVCAINNFEEARLLIEKRSLYPSAPKLIFTSGVLSQNLSLMGDKADGVEGLSSFMSPYSGFESSYKILYNETPFTFEGHFYDALMLGYVAAVYHHYTGETITLNESVRRLSDQPYEDPDLYSCNTPVWDHYLLGRNVLDKVKNGQLPDYAMLGACNILKFVENGYTTLKSSFYVHWAVYNSNFTILNYVSTAYGRTMNYEFIWKMEIFSKEEFDNELAFVSYSDLKEQWAVLVCGSHEWVNYRHQADVLNMYRMLKEEGLDDSNIILIMRDDIAYNEKNPYPGYISIVPDGPNLYEDIVIDYRADTLSVKDIQDILEGKSSDRLHSVVESSEFSNILFYWSGHGDIGHFRWLDTEEVFTGEMLRNTLENMYNNGRYRKIFLCAEPCHSASVVKVVEGLPGILAMASADEDESSYADFYNSELGVWMCDRFTYNLVSVFKSKGIYITFKYYYEEMLKQTIGSHLKVFNAENFGNLHYSFPSEFYSPTYIELIS